MATVPAPQSSLKYKIIFALVVIVTVIFAAFKFYEYQLDRSAMTIELEQLSVEKVTRLSKNLALPLWEVDEDWAEEVILSEMLDPRVYAVSVEGEGDLHVAKVRDVYGQVFDARGEVSGDYVVQERHVVNGRERIGTVKLCVTKAYMAAELQNWVLRELLTTLVLIVLISLSLWVMFNTAIIRPLGKLLEVSQAVAGGDYSRSIDISGKDEIATLSGSFNAMQESIQRREQQLSEANAQLEQDIADLIKAEESLNKWHHIFHNAGWGIAAGLETLDMMNPEYAQMHGYEVEEMIGMPVEEAYSPQARKVLPDIIKRLEDEGQVTFQSEHVRKDGSVFPVEVNVTAVKDDNGNVLYRAVNVLDITERIRMQSMMVQTEKMLSVGGLAAGMAHEINNPLSGVLQGIQNVRRRLSRDLPANAKVADELGLDFDKLQDYLDKRNIVTFFDSIADAGQRASSIVVNMLGFSRRGGDEMVPTDIAELVDQVVNLAALDYDLKKQYDFKNITLERDFASGVPEAPCVSSEVQQVLLNLLTNAAHAFHAEGRETEGPCITLRVAQDGEAVRIDVADNGPGMSEEVRARVFEPFFTTKPPGKGTGLGLSVAYYIISDEHHGRMEVESKSGQGTTFKIWLPLKQE